MTTYICKCGRRVKKSTDASTTGNRLSGYAPGHECWGCPYAMPYGDFQWDESARTVSRETRGYECRMSKTLTYASEFAGSIKDKCTCRVHSLDFDFLSQVSAWIKDTYPDREIFGSFSKDIRASDYGSDGRYCLTITCAQNLKGVAAKRELFGQFFNPDGSRKDMTPQQEMEKILADIKKAKEILSCAPAQNADAAVTTAENAVPTATAATPTISESGADASASTPATSLQNCESAPAASAGDSSVSTAGAMQDKPLTFIREDKCPAFDYSGLTDQTVENLHFAEDEYRHGKQMAERGLVHMGNAIAAAHDALCGVVQLLDNSKHGNRGDDSFRAWCCSIGITKSTAYNLLQVSALMDGSSPRQRAILEALPPTLLYAVAKPSAPQELVEKVKSGDITTNKQYQEAMAQIKAEKDRAAAAEAREEEAWNMVSKAQDEAQTAKNDLDAALADVQGLDEENARLKAEKEKAERSYNEMYESRIAANLQRQKAEAERDRAEARAKDAENQLVGSRQVAEAAKLRGDKLKAENEAYKALANIQEQHPEMSYTSSFVIGRDPLDSFWGFTLDRGTLDGVAVHDAVISDEGYLLGVVVEVEATSCKVMTILHPNFNAAGVVSRTRDNGIITGSADYAADGLCILSNLARSTLSREGDQVITTGLGGVFPPDVLVGVIKELTPEASGKSTLAVIQPGADPRTVRHVFIITNY